MKQPVDSTLPRVAFDFIVKAEMNFACLATTEIIIFIYIHGRLISFPTKIKTILLCMQSFFACRGGYYPPEVVTVAKCTSVCCGNKKYISPVGVGAPTFAIGKLA